MGSPPLCEGSPGSRIKTSVGSPVSFRFGARNLERRDPKWKTLSAGGVGLINRSLPSLPSGPSWERASRSRSAQEQICSSCWAEWLQHQTLLINHYGLDPREPKAREFLYGQIETVLLSDGEGKEIDTSQQGDIEW